MAKIKKEIWAIGGGKGGVGKSIITTNIALALSNKGKSVAIVDADFGSSNMHTYLGMPEPRHTLFDFISDQVTSINDAVTQTPFENVLLLGGGEDTLKVSNLKIGQTEKLCDSLEKIEADYILIDLGAGTTIQTIDMFIRADKGILVSMPEPASIENAYRFIKYSILRRIKSIVREPRIRNYMSQVMTYKLNERQQSPITMIEKISSIDEKTGNEIRNCLNSMNLKLILNQVRNNGDVRLGFSISSSCQKYFGVRVEYTGFIETDDNIQQSARSRIPVIKFQPFSKSSRGIKKITENLETNAQVVTAIL